MAKQSKKHAGVIAALLLAGTLGLFPRIVLAAAVEVPSTVTSLSAAAAYGTELKLTGNMTMDCDFSGSLELNGYLLTLSGDRLVSGSITGNGSIALAGYTLYNSGTVTAPVTSNGTVRVAGSLPLTAASVSYDGSAYETARYGQGGVLWLLSGSDSNTPLTVAAFTDSSGVRYVLSGASYQAQYNVSYLDDDGTALTGLTPLVYSAGSGPVALPAGLKKEGYSFAGWSGTGVSLDGASIVQGTAGDLVLTAVWTQGGGMSGGASGASGGTSGAAGGISLGSASGSLGDDSQTETVTQQEEESVSTDALAEAAQSSAAAEDGIRVSRGNSSTKTSLATDQKELPDEELVAGITQSAGGGRLWKWLLCGGLLAAGLAGAGVLARQSSKRRMAEMCRRLHISDEE